MTDSNSNLRSAVITEPNLTPPANLGPSVTGAGSALSSSGAVLRTPYAGNVRALATTTAAAPVPPPVPQFPFQQAPAYGGGFGALNGLTGGAYGAAYNNYGGGYNNYGFGGGYNSFGGLGGFGGYAGAYNRFGAMNGGMGAMNDPETRFIQMAEASSRPAFQSIESLVSAIGNIAAMLDSTFFALTSSFRAILGVAANFGRLRSVFAQFWGTFAIFRGLNWIYRKILYWLRISNLDPSTAAFKQAFAEALNDTHAQQNGGGAASKTGRKTSPWPVIAFISFIFTAPYLIMKLLGTVTNTAQEEARDPTKWISPIHTTALYDFQARNPTELSLRAGIGIQLAPREIQQTLGLLNTGFALATINGQQSGIIPINYVKSPQQLRQEQQQQATQNMTTEEEQRLKAQQPELMNLNTAAFPAPPTTVQQQISEQFPNFEIAAQPFGLPPTTDVAAIAEGFA